MKILVITDYEKYDFSDVVAKPYKFKKLWELYNLIIKEMKNFVFR